MNIFLLFILAFSLGTVAGLFLASLFNVASKDDDMNGRG